MPPFPNLIKNRNLKLNFKQFKSMKKTNTKCRCINILLTKKILLTMKLITFFLVVCIMHISASSYSQGQKINISVKHSSLEKVFQEIEKQTNFRFLYRIENIENKQADLNCTNFNIEQILDQLFVNQDLTYRILDNNLVVVTSKESLQQKVTGTVTDVSNGEPLIGVSVRIEGTNNGTITDVNGKFSIEASTNAVLVFSFLGYISEKVTVAAGQSNVEVKLVADIQKLEEVVVVGYGTQKKETLTGSISQASGTEIAKSPSLNVSSNL